MVLTDREIQAAIQYKQIVIDPPPNAETAYSSTSVDLSLSKSLRVWKTTQVKGLDEIVCPGTKGYSYGEFSQARSELKEMGDDGYVIDPHAFVLGWTTERVDLSTQSRLAARVEGKSSLARIGIGIHITAPTIHAGFKGQIQLEICNHGLFKVRLIPGMPVCQLIFEQSLGIPEKGYRGQFYGQSNA